MSPFGVGVNHYPTPIAVPAGTCKARRGKGHADVANASLATHVGGQGRAVVEAEGALEAAEDGSASHALNLEAFKPKERTRSFENRC